ncbi:MAG: ABC transporter substrate-binding protein [Bacillota bacterium]
MSKRIALLVLVVVFIGIFVLAGCSSKDSQPNGKPDAAQDGPVFGGALKVIIDAEPPTIDMHVSTTTLVYNVGWHIFEQLYALDEQFAIVPMLADGMPVISDDKLTYTIKLREGVKFHNGKEMTSADVVASIMRWGEVSSNGKALFKSVASFEADGPYN